MQKEIRAGQKGGFPKVVLGFQTLGMTSEGLTRCLTVTLQTCVLKMYSTCQGGMSNTFKCVQTRSEAPIRVSGNIFNLGIYAKKSLAALDLKMWPRLLKISEEVQYFQMNFSNYYLKHKKVGNLDFH